VLITEKCAELLPDYFSFVKGVVDSELTLNISRETIQQSRQLKLIGANIEKKIKSELLDLLKNDREKYEEFYKAFGLQLKAGVYSSYGMNKDTLVDLLMFTSSSEEKYTTLEEYVTRMREDQKYIYYASGESIQRIKNLPQTEMIREKGYEILYLTENVDEFAVKMLGSYKEKQFMSVSSGDLGLDTPEEKEEIKAKSEENKEMFTFMKDSLDGKVKEVRLSQRLKSHPFCLTSDGELSLEMEKVLNAMPTDNKVKAERVLEINPEHGIFEKLRELYSSDKDTLKKYTDLLYTQALLIEGLSVEDPVEFSNMICDLMIK
jgi:molecular chaperone HtpG